MDIISKFVREQKRYSQKELMHIFHFSSDEVVTFITNLKAFGVLKAVNKQFSQNNLSDLLDEDIAITNIVFENDANFYVFTYVGIIMISNRIIKCFPKFLISNEQPIDEMRQVIKVLEKYSTKQQIVNMFNGDGDTSSFNILSVIIFLLKDYYENDIYDNTKDIFEINGSNEIIWNKTIDEGVCFLSDNRPFHIDLYTKKTVDNEFDFFKLMHECILTECSNHLEKSGLLDLFDMEKVFLTDKELSSFGDTDYILYRLQLELNTQFNTRKQILLKTLYAYISYKRTLEDNYGVSLYGTNHFNLVWEDVCSSVFNNQLNTVIEHLDLPINLHDKYDKEKKLIDIIDTPVWKCLDQNKNEFQKTTHETLIPDIVALGRNNGITQFTILDAKYYNLQLEYDKDLRGNPGIGDVTKQYLYQLAYKQFIEDHKIEVVKNYFLMPTEGKEFLDKGLVSIEMMSNLGLSDIQIRMLPASTIFEFYLNNERIDVSIL